MGHKYNKDVEQLFCDIIVSREVSAATNNTKTDNDDFEKFIDMFNADRTSADYEWMSDVVIPEFTSQALTQSSLDTGQYFQTRDFVEVFVMDSTIEALKSAEASQELINRTLNRRGLYHYQKFVRAKILTMLSGRCYLECWWEQEYDNDGNVVDEHFNYDIHDQRNVFTSPEYTYSLGQKRWVIIREEKTKEQLFMDKERMGYINLDLLKNMNPPSDTETKKETLDREITGSKTNPDNLVGRPYDIYRRYGYHWIMKNGSPGLDVKTKEPKKGAKLKLLLIQVAVANGNRLLIGFDDVPYKDANGKPFIPIIRPMCYVHPTEDAGVGDGKFASELQTAINDTFNLSFDRTRLATMPTLKGKRTAIEDTDQIYFEPGHIIPLEDPSADLMEMRFDDNIIGALQQQGTLTEKMQQVTSIYPTTMGATPQIASTTATAIAGAAQQTNQRLNYKSMTFENTGLAELYWMINHMTLQFASPELGFRLMGEKVYDFDPSKDYFYRPLSQSIESDQGKTQKAQLWIQLFGYVAQIPHPDTVKQINYIVGKVAELMGDEYANFAMTQLNSDVPIQQQGGQGTPEKASTGQGASNQYGIPQSTGETQTRGMMNAD